MSSAHWSYTLISIVIFVCFHRQTVLSTLITWSGFTPARQALVGARSCRSSAPAPWKVEIVFLRPPTTPSKIDVKPDKTKPVPQSWFFLCSFQVSIQDTPFLNVLDWFPPLPPASPRDRPTTRARKLFSFKNLILIWFVCLFLYPPTLHHERTVHGVLSAHYECTVIIIIITITILILIIIIL